MDKIYIHKETGAAYRLHDGEVESTPLPAEFNVGKTGNFFLSVDDENWCTIDPYYGEPIPHEGKEYTVYEFEKIIHDILTQYDESGSRA